MQDAEQASMLDRQVKDAAVKYVKQIFRQAGDSELIQALKKESFNYTYKKMIVDPDDFMARPRPADIAPWNGRKPSGPRELLKSKVVLPSLPQIFPEIQKVIKNPESSVNDLVEVINKDPKLVVAFLRLANSSMFDSRAEVDTISRAVALLGFKQASSLALGTASLSRFKRLKGTSVLPVEKFWKHCMACGIIAQEIAKATGREDVERFFVAGVLHDIGLFVLFESDRSLAMELCESTVRDDNSLCDAELNLLGFDHATLGELLIRDWNFPESLAIAATGHHHPGKAKNDPDAGIVHVADFISQALGYGLGISSVIGVIDDETIDKIGLSTEQYIKILPVAQKRLETVFEILHPA